MVGCGVWAGWYYSAVLLYADRAYLLFWAGGVSTAWITKNEQRLGARRLAFLGSLRSVDGFSYRDGDSARRSRSAGAFALDNCMILSKN